MTKSRVAFRISQLRPRHGDEVFPPIAGQIRALHAALPCGGRFPFEHGHGDVRRGPGDSAACIRDRNGDGMDAEGGRHVGDFRRVGFQTARLLIDGLLPQCDLDLYGIGRGSSTDFDPTSDRLFMGHRIRSADGEGGGPFPFGDEHRGGRACALPARLRDEGQRIRIRDGGQIGDLPFRGQGSARDAAAPNADNFVGKAFRIPAGKRPGEGFA